MKKKIKKLQIVTFSCLILTLFLFVNNAQAQPPHTYDCVDPIQNVFPVCGHLPELAQPAVALASAAAPPAFAYCAGPGSPIINSAILCQLPASRGATVPMNRPVMDQKSLDTRPIISIANPYDGNPGCTVYSGKNPLILKAGIQTSKPKKGAGISKSKSTNGGPNKMHPNMSPLDICKKDCGKAMQWSITHVDKISKGQGCFIQPVGQDDQYLCWNKGKGVSFCTQSDDMTEEEWKRMVWHVGAAELTDKEVTGYRIMSAADFNYGLVVDKKTGGVTIGRIFQMNDMEKGKPLTFKPNKEDATVWRFDNCRNSSSTK